MTTLRFEGASDDTFGEYAHFREDFDNCGTGLPIHYRLTGPVIDGRPAGEMLVIGHYCPGEHATGWMIGVARCGYDDDAPLPDWPMHYEFSDRPYSPQLVIEAPEGVAMKCLERE